MANVMTNYFKAQNTAGNVSLSADQMIVALTDNIFGSSATDDLNDINNWSEISASWEITGTGYDAGGIALSGQSIIQDNVNNLSKFDADDVTWSNATLTSYGAAISRQSDGLLVCLVDFSGAKSSTNGDFTVQWNSDGILTLS